MKIIVVDDDEDILEILGIFFQSKGHTFKGFTTASGGLKEIEHNHPDIVFLDINLPDADGIETMTKIIQMNGTIPVVMITAYKNAEKVVEAFRKGAMDCLLKPFNFEYLENRILAKTYVKPNL